MQNLEMESGPKYLKQIILGFVVLIFAAGAYVLTRSSGDDAQKNQEHALSTGSNETASADTAMMTPESTIAADTAAPSPAVPAGAQASEPVAATQPPKAESASAVATAPTSATPAAKSEVAAVKTAPEPAATAEKSSSAAASSEVDTETLAEPKPVTSSQKKSEKTVATKQAPPVDALRSWWSNGSASPFNVQYVGQLQDAKSLVIMFSGDVQDPNAAKDHIRVLAEDGSPVDANWQVGGNSRMLVQNDLQPGRYTVMIDPAVANAQGQSLGTSLHGPVYIQ